MKAIKRTMLYLSRNKAKNIILLLLIFVMVTGMLISFSLFENINKAKQEFATTLKANFTIMPTDSDIDYEQYDSGEENTSKQTEYITINTIRNIKTMDGIVAYTTLSRKLVDSGLELYPAGYSSVALNWKELGFDISVKEDRDMVESAKHWRHYTEVLSSADTAYLDYFITGAFDLVEGRHIKETDTGKALISKYIADNNNLKVGDNIDICQKESMFVFNYNGDYDLAIGKKTRLEIIGIFDVNFAVDDSGWSCEPEIAHNFIFTDMNVGNILEKYRYEYLGYSYDKNRLFLDSIKFYVDDPAHIDGIINKIKESNLINLYRYHFETQKANGNESYSIANSIVESVLSSAWIISTGCFALIIIFLVFREKTRAHENRVYMAIGIKRRSVVIQKLLEIIILYVIGIIASLLVVNTILPLIGMNTATDTENSNPQYQFEVNHGTGEHDIIVNQSIIKDIDFNLSNNTPIICLSILSGLVLAELACAKHSGKAKNESRE